MPRIRTGIYNRRAKQALSWEMQENLILLRMALSACSYTLQYAGEDSTGLGHFEINYWRASVDPPYLVMVVNEEYGKIRRRGTTTGCTTYSSQERLLVFCSSKTTPCSVIGGNISYVS